MSDNVKGFDFYAAKDFKMAENADYGFMVWNGISKGTLNNIINLTKQNKNVLIYFTPHKKFYTVNNLDAAKKLVSTCSYETSNLFMNLTSTKIPLNTNNAEQLTLFSNDIIGFDLVDEQPDYTKTLEENQKIYAEKYKKVYGEYPKNYKEDSIK